jgi:glutamate carboxypeptidase
MSRTENQELGRALLDRTRRLEQDLVDLLCELVRAESPTDVPESQSEAQRILSNAFGSLGWQVDSTPGERTGGYMVAGPEAGNSGKPIQLLVGHSDTVWPLGTLADMPVRMKDGTLTGPGVYDMKAGLAQIVFAARALQELGLEPPVEPVALVTTDEEIGSPESWDPIVAWARRSCRAFILEPAYGLDGKIKTARKGGGSFEVTIRGRAAHAGLDPTAGASAILELSHVIQRLHSLTDHERGITVNVGVIEGGLRPNVVAPESRAHVDVRILHREDAEPLERAIRSIEPQVEGVTLEITGGIQRKPLERTPRNRLLWEAARSVGVDLDLRLESATVGGGSDGNITSQHTATLDGLGAVGDGAHARHEFVFVDRLAERTALLARLLLLPPDATEPDE